MRGTVVAGNGGDGIAIGGAQLVWVALLGGCSAGGVQVVVARCCCALGLLAVQSTIMHRACATTGLTRGVGAWQTGCAAPLFTGTCSLRTAELDWLSARPKMDQARLPGRPEAGRSVPHSLSNPTKTLQHCNTIVTRVFHLLFAVVMSLRKQSSSSTLALTTTSFRQR